MFDIEETGGARVGYGHATFPFATLKVNKNELILNASILGVMYFRPSDIISIEPYTLFKTGLKINHRVAGYSKKVVFNTMGGTRDLIARIEETGFLKNTDSIPSDVEAEIAKYQTGGSFPIKISAVIAIVVIWNVLFLSDHLNIFHNNQKDLVAGPGSRMALAFMFLTCLALLVSDPIRLLILKEGRVVGDVSKFLYFIMFITGVMFIALSFLP